MKLLVYSRLLAPASKKKTVHEKQVVFYSEKYDRRAKAERAAALAKAECSHAQQNYYLFNYYDNILLEISNIFDIDFSKRIRSLGEIKKILANTKK